MARTDNGLGEVSDLYHKFLAARQDLLVEFNFNYVSLAVENKLAAKACIAASITERKLRNVNRWMSGQTNRQTDRQTKHSHLINLSTQKIQKRIHPLIKENLHVLP
jgi:hypothetical protein